MIFALLIHRELSSTACTLFDDLSRKPPISNSPIIPQVLTVAEASTRRRYTNHVSKSKHQYNKSSHEHCLNNYRAVDISVPETPVRQ